MWRTVLTISVLALALAQAGDWPSVAPAPRRETPSHAEARRSQRGIENDALAAAAADLHALPPAERLLTRWIWIADGKLESLKAVALALNMISRSTVLVRPVPVGDDRVLLARVSLPAYAPRIIDDLNDWLKIWEEFQFDPRFSLLVTRDTLRFAAGVKIPKIKKQVRKTRDKLIDVEPFEQDGKTYNQKWITETFAEEVEVAELAAGDVIRQPSGRIDQRLLAELILQTQSQAPVVNHAYFLTRALTAVQNQGLAKTLYGGLYYRFAGIRKGFPKGTDEDNLFEQLGIGNVKQGVTADKIFDRLRSDQRVAVFRSGVTAKPRRIDLLRSLAGRDSQSILAVTHDLKDEDVDIGQHPLMNLLNFKDEAREVIFEKPNGLHGFVLFNGQGALQDEAPFDVVLDHTIPEPFTRRLQPAIGCIRCHGKEGGWRVVTNDVKRLLSGYVDVFGDSSDRKKSTPDVLDRLAGLYAGNLERKLLPRARNDYANAVLQTTGPWPGGRDQTDAVQRASDTIGELYGGYVYQLVTAKTVLTDLGVPIETDPAAQLRRLLPPVPVVIDGVIPEDPRIAALFMGLGIGRPDYDLVYSFLAGRIGQKYNR